MTRDRLVYLAAPFFNEPELEVVTRIEQRMDFYSANLSYFSPRKDGGNAGRQGTLADNKTHIFNTNLKAMVDCTDMLAWIDRPQPPGLGIYLCKDGPLDNMRQPIKGPFEQTDLGTAWEMGFIRGWNAALRYHKKCVAAFTTKPRDDVKTRINIMLCEGVNAILYGWEELDTWLKYVDAEEALACNPHFKSNWKGGLT